MPCVVRPNIWPKIHDLIKLVQTDGSAATSSFFSYKKNLCKITLQVSLFYKYLLLWTKMEIIFKCFSKSVMIVIPSRESILVSLCANLHCTFLQ